MNLVRIKFRKLILAGILICFLPLSGFAQMQVHEVAKGETLYSISKHYDVTIDDIVRANPDMPDLKKNKVKQGNLLNIPKKQVVQPTAIDTIRLAVVLPFSSSKQITDRMLEFYRGLLTATYAAKESGYSVEISAFDEPKQSESIAPILEMIQRAKPDFVVGPLYPTHFKEIHDYSLSNKQRTLIPFSSKVSEINHNPYLYLLNTPSHIAQRRIVNLFDETFKGSRLVLVRTQDATQIETTNFIMEHCLKKNYEVQTLPALFFAEDLTRVLSTERKNVLILDGSERSNVVKVLTTIEEFIRKNPGYDVCVVGHNDWQLFAMEEKPLLSKVNSYILASDFYNAYDQDVINFEASYYKWFNSYPAIYHPRMGELGYDSGLFMLNAIAIYGSKFENQPVNANYIQTNFKFKQVVSNGGYANVSIMFIHYQPDSKVECIELN